MIGETLKEAVAGSTARWRQQLFEEDGITPYAADPSWWFACTLWPGGSQPGTVTPPTAVWDDADAGTYLLTIPPAASYALGGLTYRLTVHVVTPDGTFPAFVGRCRFETTAGVDAPIPVYGDYADLLAEADWIGDGGDPEDGIAGYLRQRGAARDVVDAAILAHAGGGNWDTLGGLYGAAWGTSGRDMYVLGLLAADRLVITPQLRRAVALLTLARVCRGRMTPMGKGTQYAAFARSFQAEADEALSTLVAEIDDDGDGVAELFITIGTARTRWG